MLLKREYYNKINNNDYSEIRCFFFNKIGVKQKKKYKE